MLCTEGHIDHLILEARQLFVSMGTSYISLTTLTFNSSFEMLCAIDLWADCVTQRPYALDPNLFIS